MRSCPCSKTIALISVFNKDVIVTLDTAQEFRENVIVRGGALDPSDMSPAMANLPPAVNISRADVKESRLIRSS